MTVFAIGDLHLSSVNPKPMDVFGEEWINHWGKISSYWMDNVSDTDYIIIPGDISWAIKLDEAIPDLVKISNMPGKKILLQGNHDYWWSSPSKIRKILPENMEIIQNDFVDIVDFYVCGSRGWSLPGDERFSESDDKIYKRELIRLELSLSKAAAALDKPIIVAMHFPPFDENGKPSLFVDIMKKYNVVSCVYGHLHSYGTEKAFEGIYDGIEFHLVSCDYIGFKPKKIIL